MTEQDARFPLVYEASGLTKTLAVVGIFGVLAVLMVVGFGGRGEGHAYSLVLIGGTVLISGSILATLRRRVRLYPDRFEYRWELGTVLATKSDIRGYRIARPRYGQPHVVLDIKAHPLGRCDVSEMLVSDPFLKGWLSDLRDLDAGDKEDFEAALRDNPAFGHSYPQRETAIAKLRWASLIFNIICGGLAIWLVFAHYPLELSLGACLAAVAAGFVVAGLSKGRFALMYDLTMPKLKLTGAFLPGIALGLYGFLYAGLIDKAALYLPSLAIGCGLAYVVSIIDGRASIKALGFAAIALSIFAFGGLTLMNRYGDTSVASVYRLPVTSKDIGRGSKGSTYYYVLGINPAQSIGLPAELKTNAVFYERTRIGDPICVQLYRGALGASWFEWDACPAAPMK